MLPILNTKQYDQWKAYFVHGINALHKQLDLIETRQHWSLTKIPTFSTVLIGVAKKLSAFLSVALSLLLPMDNDGKIRQPENARLSAAIGDLRVACHRYS